MNATTQTAVETAPVQETAPQPVEHGEQQEGGAMPPEERSKQAARRRALEQRAEALRANEREAKLRQEVLEHPLVKEAMTLLEKTRFQKDLDRVREAYPSLTAKSPKEVGEIYCRLMASGAVDPVVAYEAQAAADRRRNPIPENMVSAKSAGGAAQYYSSQELDRLTEKDLKDPNVFRKAMASLSKLRS
ncbi:MAG: hypothetical protein IJC46_03295 [Clostridia bacterium]|nr:hypothetical protein [Clostridia bacterium]